MSIPEFVNEPVLVEARLLPDGQMRPIAFAWRGRPWRVANMGRQWDEKDEEGVTWRCFLVRTREHASFELRLEPASGRWLLARAWLRPDRV